MKFNGLMIDCSRLMERHGYYYKLIDFMAEWGMNTLLLHFSDDYGLAIKLPGFEHLAMPKAFTAAEARKLIKYAARKGIEIIPELETFGHTRFITDNPRYRHLYAGVRDRKLVFNAIDPLSSETHDLMKAMIAATAKLFPSRYFHVGCDEVNLKPYCEQRGLNEATTWADYVNKMLEYARAAGKTPMMWADHPVKSEELSRCLSKDVILVVWRYENRITDKIDGEIKTLKSFGFKHFVVAPGIACYRYRFLPSTIAFQNTVEMSALAVKHRTMGVLNTIWCPWRYLQNTLYYAIAHSAMAVRAGGKPDMKALNRRFAGNVFGTALTPELESFLTIWPDMKLLNNWCNRVHVRKYAETPPNELREIIGVCDVGDKLVDLAGRYRPARNKQIWDAMVLAAKAGLLTMRRLMWGAIKFEIPREQKRAFNKELAQVNAGMSREWDRTRYAGDPRKYRVVFATDESQFIMIQMKKMERAK